MKLWYPINSIFFREEIRYVHDDFILRNKMWFCAMVEGRDNECMAGPETIQNRSHDWSSGLAIPFVFLRQQDPPHQFGNQSQLFHARLKLAVWLKVASHPARLFLHQLQGRKQTLPRWYFHISIQTEGPGIAVLQKI